MTQEAIVHLLISIISFALAIFCWIYGNPLTIVPLSFSAGWSGAHCWLILGRGMTEQRDSN